MDVCPVVAADLLKSTANSAAQVTGVAAGALPLNASLRATATASAAGTPAASTAAAASTKNSKKVNTF